jgi:hypothetical protein
MNPTSVSACVNNCTLMDETLGVVLPFVMSQPCSQYLACLATGGAVGNDPDQLSLSTYAPYILGAALFIGAIMLVNKAGGR